MAEPSFPGSVSQGDKEDEESDEEDTTGTAKGKTKGSLTKFGELCPHKAFPSKFVDRNIFKTQKDYTNFLLKNPREGQPWYTPPDKIKVKLRGESSLKWLAQARKLKLRAKPPEESDEKEMDMSRYIIMEQPCKKKKVKKKKLSKMGYEIKVNKELAFLLDVMADSKEAMIQKAIDYQRQKEEEERKAKEEGDIKVLKNIVQGMMFKVMQEHEESQKEKPPRRKVKKDKKKKKKDIKAEEDATDSEEKVRRCQLKKMNANTTKELVSFLKDLVENDKKKKDATFEEKSVSPYVSEEFVSSVILEETIEAEIIEEEEEEEEEDAEEGEEEEGGGDDQREEGVVDMEEVKKKLEAITEGEEEGEQEERGSVSSTEKEGLQETMVPETSQDVDGKEGTEEEEEPKPLMADKSAQFNYFQERKALLDKKPKNITDDLALFLKTMIMTDDNMREIMREKELLEFKRKQLDFMTMGMFLQKPEKDKKKKKDKKGKKSKTKCKGAEMSKDLAYNVRPNEFMLMLQVIMNALDVMDDQKKLEDQINALLTKESSSQVSSESSTYTEEVSVEEDNDEEEEEDDEEDEGEDEEEDDDDEEAD